MTPEERIERYLLGKATEEDVEILNEVLLSDEEVRKAFRFRVELDGGYREAAMRDSSAATVSEFPLQSQARKRSWIIGKAGTIAAMLVVAVVALGFWQFVREPAQPVARILDRAQAVFGAEKPVDGSLDPKSYSLLSGMVAMEFRNGVVMTVRGPAQFEIVDELRVVLDSGQARAFAPESGHGFTIETPEADLVDLGTEFGVSVDPESGGSHVQVFDGRVDVKQRGDRGKVVPLDFGDSVRVDREGVERVASLSHEVFPTPSDLAAARWLELDREIREDGEVLLYYAFDRQPGEDRTLFDESVSAERIDGSISGARWVTGRWAGKDALLFDRPGDAVEFEIPGEIPRFTVSLWMNVDRFDYALTPILNSAGWEEGDFHLQISRSRGTAFAAVYPGRLKSATEAAMPTGRWIHLAAVVDLAAGTASTWIDGRLAVRSQVSDEAILRPGRCRLGSWQDDGIAKDARNRGFRGRIDEVVVWRSALSPMEIRRLAETGRP